jgi:hypothetical protein
MAVCPPRNKSSQETTDGEDDVFAPPHSDRHQTKEYEEAPEQLMK